MAICSYVLSPSPCPGVLGRRGADGPESPQGEFHRQGRNRCNADHGCGDGVQRALEARLSRDPADIGSAGENPHSLPAVTAPWSKLRSLAGRKTFWVVAEPAA